MITHSYIIDDNDDYTQLYSFMFFYLIWIIVSGSIWGIGGIWTDTTTSVQSGYGSNCNEGVFHTS